MLLTLKTIIIYFLFDLLFNIFHFYTTVHKFGVYKICKIFL